LQPRQQGLSPIGDPAAQTGSALIISLIFLIVMSLIGITAMQNTTLEERMAGNMRDHDLSFQAAEAASRDAEEWLGPGSLTSRPPACTNPLLCDVWEKNYLIGLVDFTVPDDTWWNANSHEYGSDTGAGNLAEVSSDPRYLIEEVDFVPDSLVRGIGVPTGRNFYGVTALGAGGTDAAQTVVETTFTRRF
jgi:type IV pilus assembly protein PilX